MPNLGTTELIIILVIVILIFGAGKLGSVGSALGKGVSDFRKAVKTDDEEAEKEEKKGEAKKASSQKKASVEKKEDLAEDDSEPSEE